MALGEKISKLIREKGMTQRELADKIGVTEYSMAMFIKDERIPRITYLKNLSIALGVSLDYLCEDDEPEKESPLKPKKEEVKATIKIENTETFGYAAAVRGARNAFQSWDKSDSYMDGRTFVIGEDDLALLKKLANAGSDHGKFLRMIHVQADVTAPVYFMQELATYKIGTTMNSTSLQHTGARRDFTIRDFSVPDNRMYDILDPPIRDFKSENPIIYPYETDEYRDYITESGRKYKVFRNGRIFSYPFEYVDSYGTGRHRTFEEREISPYQNNGGYWVVRIGGRPGEHIQLHRLIAKVWLGDRSNEGLEVNHKNKNRGDCSVENLEWLTHQENNIHKHETYETPIWTKYKKHLLSTKYPSYKKMKSEMI